MATPLASPPTSVAPRSGASERAPVQLLAWCFVASEATFFALLIIAFVALTVAPGHGRTPEPGASSLDPLHTGLYSIFLFASSATLAWGERGVARGRVRLTLGLLVTAALGIVFLAFQGAEWARLLAAGVTVPRNVFGTSFYTLTGFHGAHVAIGVLMLLILTVLAAAGALRGARGAVAAAAIYWHFVDAVWVVIYAVVYLAGTR